MQQSVTITGVRSIDRRLKTLEPRLQKKVLRQSMRAGLKILAAEIKGRINSITGAMRAAVQVRAVKRRRRGSIELEVRLAGNEQTVKQNAGNGKRVFYPAVVEFGDKDRSPQAPVRGSLAAKGEAARQTTIERIRSGIEREASHG